MTKKQDVLLKNPRLLITSSLLNSWRNIYFCEKYVKEKDDDKICVEDKILEEQKKAKEDFINTLKRIPSTPNVYMQKGIDFEEDCYKYSKKEELTEEDMGVDIGVRYIGNLMKKSQYQMVGTKNISVGDVDFLVYGRLDFLKCGTIYDIKRVSSYTTQKYLNSCQHSIYMFLFPSAYKFEYLAYDGKVIHHEVYYKDECEDVEIILKQFIDYLKDNDLFDLYVKNWKSNGGK